MVKFLCIIVVAIFPNFAWAGNDLECTRDDRFRDGDKVEFKVKVDSLGVATAYLTVEESGMVAPGAPSPVSFKDKIVAANMRCIASKLDQRILSCANTDWSETVSSTLTSKSVLEALGPGDVTHNLVEEFVVAIKSRAENQTIDFGAADCVLK